MSHDNLRLKWARIRVNAIVPIITTTLNEKPNSNNPVFCLKIQHPNTINTDAGISKAGI